jgi:hypothetical protein
LGDNREEGDIKGINGHKGPRDSMEGRGTQEVIPWEEIGIVEDSLEMKDRDILLRVDSRELLAAVGGLPEVGDKEHGCNHGGSITASMEMDIVWEGIHTIPTSIRGCMDTTEDSRWDIRGGGPISPHM